jgi:hypothetical protein
MCIGWKRNNEEITDEETAKGRQKVGHRERERVSTKIMIEFKVIW